MTASAARGRDPLLTKLSSLGCGDAALSTDEQWIQLDHGRGQHLPAQGIKLHVSASLSSAVEVVERIVPVLRERQVACKFAAGLDVLFRLNTGQAGATQVGKFATIYPGVEDDPVELAQALHEATSDLSGPRIPSDHALAPSSLVHYRYGVIAGRVDPATGDRDISRLVTASGEEIADDRSAASIVPSWAEDPFVKRGARDPGAADDSLWSAGRFLPHSILRARPRGSVIRAVQLDVGPRRVVIKEGLRAGEESIDGFGARQCIDRQQLVLHEMAEDDRFALVYERADIGGDAYLVMEDVGGRSLAEELKLQPASRLEAARWTSQAGEILATLHRAGWAWTDLGPDNLVVVDRCGESLLRVADVEHAVPINGRDPVRARTAGFTPPHPAPPIDQDRYALWALAAHLIGSA